MLKTASNHPTEIVKKFNEKSLCCNQSWRTSCMLDSLQSALRCVCFNGEGSTYMLIPICAAESVYSSTSSRYFQVGIARVRAYVLLAPTLAHYKGLSLPSIVCIHASNTACSSAPSNPRTAACAFSKNGRCSGCTFNEGCDTEGVCFSVNQ